MNKLNSDNLVRTSWFILIVIYLVQLFLIYKYSIDVPFKDEWIYLKPGHPLSLPDTLTLKWLFSRVSEHTIVTTNLLTWLNFKLFGLDFFKQKIINFLIFGLLLCAIITFKNKIIGCSNFRIFPVFLFFLLSPIAVENHTWGFQSQIHLVLIFFVLMLIYLRNKPLSKISTAMFLSAGILAIYSFAAGVIFAAVCLVFRNVHIASLVTSGKQNRRAGLVNAAVCTIIIGGITALWFTGYEKPEYIPPRVWPNEVSFWDYFLNMLSFGFGFDTQSLFPGVVFFIFSLLPAVLLLTDRKKCFDSDAICISAAIIAVLAVLASISFGRASIGDAKTSRYAEISFMLIPFISMGWWLLLKNSPAKNILLSLFWISCFFSYLDNWTSRQYVEVYHSDKATLDCVHNYLSSGGDAACQEYWITPAHLDKANKLRIRFTEQK